jgi:hypothetical protein
MVPVRSDVVGFAAAVYVTLPEPVPPEFVVSHDCELTAVQSQWLCVLTANVALDVPPAGTFAEPGEKAYVHGGVCVTVNVCAPTDTVAVRVVVPE